MTTYILCGGNDSEYPQFGVNLQKVVKERVEDIKLLDVYFAGDDDKAKARFDDWSGWFEEYFPDIERVLATKSDFATQVAWANVIFIHGGSTEKLLRELPNFNEVKKVLRDKIYIGSSAGANYVAEHFLSQDNGVQSGAGILKINVAVHYNADSDLGRSVEDANILEDNFLSIRTLRIKEGEFEVIEYE